MIGALGAFAVFAAAALPAVARHPYTEPGHVRLGVVRTIGNLNPLLTGHDLHGVKPAQAVSDFWNVGSWTL